jgi:hypothetical protein
MVNDNSIALTFTTNVKITGNHMNNTQGTDIFIAGGTNLTEIEENILIHSAANGIYVNTIFTTSAFPNATIRAKKNSIQGNAGAGLLVDSGAYSATSQRRLDATNNWWGRPTGPMNPSNAGGTEDVVINPENVVEFISYLTTNPLPLPPGAVVIETVGRQASTQTTTFVAAMKSIAVNQAITGSGTFAWQKLRQYSKVFTPVQAGNYIVITVEALNYDRNGSINQPAYPL